MRTEASADPCEESGHGSSEQGVPVREVVPTDVTVVFQRTTVTSGAQCMNFGPLSPSARSPVARSSLGAARRAPQGTGEDTPSAAQLGCRRSPSVPRLATAAGDVGSSVGWSATIIATGVSLVVGYASIAWLLRLVAHHSIAVFIWYRVALAIVLVVLLATGVIAAV